MNNPIVSSQINELVIVNPLPNEQNPALVYLAGLGNKRTRDVQLQSLETIANMLTGQPDVFTCNWAALRFQHTQAVRSKLAESYAPATANRFLSALRGTLKASWRLGQMTAEDYHRARDVENIKGETLPAGRELSEGEIAALIGTCEQDPSNAGARDAAIIAVMYGAGLRREEIITLDVDDYFHETGKMVVRGKRNKERTAYLLNGASRALLDWLSIRGLTSGPLFVPITKGGNLIYRRMTTQAIYNMLQKRGRDAKVSNFSPHDLRRTFITDLLVSGLRPDWTERVRK